MNRREFLAACIAAVGYAAAPKSLVVPKVVPELPEHFYDFYGGLAVALVTTDGRLVGARRVRPVGLDLRYDTPDALVEVHSPVTFPSAWIDPAAHEYASTVDRFAVALKLDRHIDPHVTMAKLPQAVTLNGGDITIVGGERGWYQLR